MDTPHRTEIPAEFWIDRQGKRFVLYAGLLDAAHRYGLVSIETTLIQPPGPNNSQTAIFGAVATIAKLAEQGERVTCRFVGHGDASPENVGRTIAPHFIRMAETRAKARALRDALNIGTAAIEELSDEDNGHHAAPPTPMRPPAQQQPVPQRPAPARAAPSGNGDGASDAQLRFLAKLGDRETIEATAQSLYSKTVRQLSKREASDLINRLKDTPTQDGPPDLDDIPF